MSLQNGLRLVYLHNSLVRKSRRHFEEIKQYHTDTAKPYRCADNLRYWVKAAELRWDIKLDVDVLGMQELEKPPVLAARGGCCAWSNRGMTLRPEAMREAITACCNGFTRK